MKLVTAQQAIAADWTTAEKKLGLKVIATNAPLSFGLRTG
jgi:hypothetical protein